MADWVTLAEIKAYLKPAANDLTGHDDLLNALISACSREIDNYLGYPLIYPTGDKTCYINGGGARFIELPYRPVNSIATVHDDLSRAWGSSTLIPASSYVVDLELGQIWLLNDLTFQCGIQNVKIVGNFGFAALSNAPSDVMQICKERVAMRFNKRLSQGISSKSLGDGSATWFAKDEFSDGQKNILNQYKKWLI